MSLPTHELMNDPDEVHAVVNGLYVGATASPGAKYNDGTESHYWRAGWLVGRGSSGLLLVGVGSLL